MNLGGACGNSRTFASVSIVHAQQSGRCGAAGSNYVAGSKPANRFYFPASHNEFDAQPVLALCQL
jgi:hypothetical protein